MNGAINLPQGPSTSYTPQTKQNLQQRARPSLLHSRKAVACKQQRGVSQALVLPFNLDWPAPEDSEVASTSNASANIPSAAESEREDCTGQKKVSNKMRKVTRKTVALIKALVARRDAHTTSSGSRHCNPPWPLLSAVTTTVLPAGGWTDLGNNYIFVAGFWGWLIAQCLKVFTKRYKQGIWDIRAVVESGGMPSSHSSLCAAVTTAVALEFGLGSSLFAVALCFTVITMYDAAGVRRHAGKQAEVLNILLEDVLQGHPVSDRKLKEVLGHTPLQVVTGAVLGVVVACFIPSPTALPVV